MSNITIAAISTPIGTGGISIVRLSGKDSLKIARKISSLEFKKIKPRYMNLIEITTKEFCDKGFFVYFKGPNSYTGEDMVELQVHGGAIIAGGILNELLNQGAVLAEPGEFTKRAFINGKLTLDKAEGVIDMINATTSSQVRAGYNLLNGGLHKKIKTLQNNTTNILAEIEAIIDYPEYDIEEKTRINFIDGLLLIKEEIKNLLKTSSMGMIIKNGISVAIIGKPNVGKSSLMNAMLNYDRSIVTNIEGTTRDTLQEAYEYKGIKINIIDTAGIRNSKNQVEKIGIKRAKKTIEYADIVLFVVDGTTNINKDELLLLEEIKKKNHIIVQNKADINNKKMIDDAFIISAEKETNIDKLKEEIYRRVVDEEIFQSDLLITNQRHVQSLKNALKSIKYAIDSINDKNSLDVVAIDISDAWQNMGEISGDISGEKIIDAIFKKFCLGK